MISDNLSFFTANSLLAELYPSVPFVWDKRSQKLKLIQNPSLARRFKYLTCLQVAFVCVLIFQVGFYFGTATEEELHSLPLSTKVTAGMWTVGLVGAVAYVNVCRKEGGQICLYVNGVFRFLKIYGWICNTFT